MKIFKLSLVGAAAIVVAVLAFAYSGVYDVAADEPHWAATYWLMETTRERSIAARLSSVGTRPKLDDPGLLAMGAEHYAEMCTGCHLAPGMDDTEMRAGLYPKPPNLAEHSGHRSVEETFWIIKHGLKMSGMPAWGMTHDDKSVWAMVAFLRKLPDLSPVEYAMMTGQPSEEDASQHAAEAAHDHAHGDDSNPEPRAH
jgi:mono/diheme cytochrome c family protein